METHLSKYIKKTQRGFLSEKNIQHYIKHHRPNQTTIDFNQIQLVKTFTTRGFFYSYGTFYPLKNTELDNGRRDTELNQAELKKN